MKQKLPPWHPTEFRRNAALILTALIGIVTGAAGSAAPAAGSGQVVSWGNLIIPYFHPSASFARISAGAGHNLSLTADGLVVAWGNNGWGQSKVPLGLKNVVAVAAGANHSLALQSDGTVVVWGDQAVLSGLANVTTIAGGYLHSLALRSDGAVVSWDSSQPSPTPSGLRDVVAIAAGRHSLALRRDGIVIGWGDNSYGQAYSGVDNVAAIAAGEFHSLALKRDGTVVLFGEIPSKARVTSPEVWVESWQSPREATITWPCAVMEPSLRGEIIPLARRRCHLG